MLASGGGSCQSSAKQAAMEKERERDERRDAQPLGPAAIGPPYGVRRQHNLGRSACRVGGARTHERHHVAEIGPARLRRLFVRGHVGEIIGPESGSGTRPSHNFDGEFFPSFLPSIATRALSRNAGARLRRAQTCELRSTK